MSNPPKCNAENDVERIPFLLHHNLHDLFKQFLANRTVPLDDPGQPPFWQELWSDKPGCLETALEQLTDNVAAVGNMFANGRYMALIPNSGNFASCLAELLLGRIDGYEDPIATLIEEGVIRWICDILGYPATSGGYLTSGGSSSTVVAFATAKEVFTRRYGLKNSSDLTKLVVYITARTHMSTDKGLVTIGIQGNTKNDVTHIVDHDDQQRMIPKDLMKKIQEDKSKGRIPFMVVATTGTTDLGSIDPLTPISKIAKHCGLWFHVDGAVGGFYAMCDAMKDQYKSISQADSIILDPHKSLSQPFGDGAVMFKNGSHKSICCEVNPSTNEVPFWTSPVEEKMMFRSFIIWFSINAWGTDTFKTVLNRNLELVKYVYDQLEPIPELVVLPPQLSILVFRCKGNTPSEANARTDQLFKGMADNDLVFLSNTTMDEYRFIRIAICNYRDNLTEIKMAVEEVRMELEDVFGIDVDRQDHPTSANLNWLAGVEKDLRWKEYDVGTKYLDRFVYLVYEKLIYGFEEPRRPEHDKAILKGLDRQSAEGKNVEDLIDVATLIQLRDVAKPECRFVGSIGHLLSCTINCLCALRTTGPGAVELEMKIITSLASACKMSGSPRGVLVSDNRNANMLAFIAARWGILKTCDRYDTAVVYTIPGGDLHFITALKVVGLGKCYIRVVKTTNSGAMDVADLRAKILEDKQKKLNPFLVAEILDDPWKNYKPEVGAICELYGIWHHVDIRANKVSWLLGGQFPGQGTGLSKTNSVSLDIGKSLSLPVGVVAAIIREHKYLHEAMAHHRNPEYLPPTSNPTDEPVYESESYSFELTRPCRAIPLWFTANILGSKACR